MSTVIVGVIAIVVSLGLMYLALDFDQLSWSNAKRVIKHCWYIWLTGFVVGIAITMALLVV